MEAANPTQFELRCENYTHSALRRLLGKLLERADISSSFKELEDSPGWCLQFCI